ncbi:MAG: 3'-5' exonuclease [Planctomycetaceae bacterium]
MSDVQYLIFDVEAVGDGDLIQRVRYPDLNLTPIEAIAHYQADLLEQTGRDVIPPTFVVPVSVAVGKVSADFRLLNLTVLDAPHFRPEHIIRRFWQGWMHYDRPTLVTFNGRSYDIPVLEFGAFRYGISLPAWFNVESRSFEQARNRYNIDRHIDLQDLFSNFSAVRVNGGLNLMSNLIYKPGKSGIDGSQVQSLYVAGEVQKINDYCRCDVLDTYFVFLRSRVLMGRLNLDQEQVLVDDVRQMLEAEAAEQPAYEHYLEFWDRRLEQQQAQADLRQRESDEKAAAAATATAAVMVQPPKDGSEVSSVMDALAAAESSATPADSDSPS